MARALETVLECTKQQNDTAEKVLNNVRQQASEAVLLEKQNRIISLSKTFGVATRDVNTLKSKLTPALPYMWRELDIKADDLEVKMDQGKRFRIMAAAETIAFSKDQLKKSIPTEEKYHNFSSVSFKAPMGRYSE